MKILLVNPYIYDFTAYDLWLRPLGLLYITAILKKYSNAELYWLDTLDRGIGENKKGRKEETKETGSINSGRGKFHREIVEKPSIYSQTPRFYARYGIPLQTFHEKLDAFPQVDMIFVTSLMTYWIDGVRFTIDALREKFPNAVIVLGGLIPSLVPHELLKPQLNADRFIGGYGENQILPLVASYGATVYPHPDLGDIHNLPYPANEFISNPVALPLMTSRGCPYHCTYCASDLLNKTFVQRRADDIYNEILYMHQTFGTRQFAVFDDALLIDKRKRFLNVFRRIIENPDLPDLNFHTPNGLHAGEIDQETADIFFQSGFKTIRLSFESVNREILTRSAGKVTPEQMIRAVDNLEKAGYQRGDIGAYLLFGVPGQRLEDIDDALEFAKDLGVKPNLSYYSPVPGTVDFLQLQKNGLISDPVNLHETNKIYFIYNRSGLDAEAIKHVKEKASRITRDARNSG